MIPAIRFVVADPIDLVTLGIESLLTANRKHIVVARAQSGTELEAALTLGTRAAAVTVSRAGANPPWREEM